MIIGCPKEVKTKEHRVGIVPGTARALVEHGHQVLMEQGAGLGSGISDGEYADVGARIVKSANEVWQKSDMIVKVKEPLSNEYDLMQEGQALFTFLHLAAEPELTAALVSKKVTSVGYETIQVGRSLPILKPMSEVAGRMAVQIGAWCLENQQGGKGLLLGGVPGTSKARVSIIGGGVVGSNAAKIALGMGAQVTVLDTNLERLEYLDHIFSGNVQTLFSTVHNVAYSVEKADLVIGAVLVTGARAPRLVTKDLLKTMADGSVIVDVAVDQGGCVETMRPTTHEKPTFCVDGVVHYGVTNIPGAVARTSTFALAHATLPYALSLADKGVENACKADESLMLGLNTFGGHVTYKAVAESHNMPYVSPVELWA